MSRTLPSKQIMASKQHSELVSAREGAMQAGVQLGDASKAFFCFVLASKDLSALLFEFAVVLLV